MRGITRKKDYFVKKFVDILETKMYAYPVLEKKRSGRNVNRMTRTETIKEIMKKSNELMKNWTRDGENEIWNMAYDWNRDHDESEEIFMCEKYDDELEELVGFYIEDDFWLYED